MEKIKIEAIVREKVGKELAKKIRKVGNVPAIIYGKGANFAVQVPLASVKILKTIHFSQNAIIDLSLVDGAKKEAFSVLIKEVQYHPLSEAAIHVDFVRVSLEEKIKVNVPVVLKGEAKGLKDEGILEQILWQLVIEGLPLDIPEKIEVDVSDLGIGNSIHVGGLKIASNLRIVNPVGETIATVVEKKEEEVVVATPETAPTGPEVIKEKKETEEGEEGEAKEGKEAKEEKDAKGKEEKSKEDKGKSKDDKGKSKDDKGKK